MSNWSAILVARLFVCLPLTCVWAQTGSSTSVEMRSPQSSGTVDSHGRLKPDAPPAPAVAASDAVITIHRPCDDSSKIYAPANPCTTIISREAFERLVDSMNVMGKELAPQTRRELAEVYAGYLAFELPATRAGLENTPRFSEVMQWWRLRTLAGLYSGSLKEQFKNPSSEEIHAYYLEHLSAYQRITVARILVPRTRGTSDDAKRADNRAHEVANNARDRVAKGEDPNLVQKDAYSALDLSSPPGTALGATSRSSFPAAETDELFSLGPGQVTKVEIEGASYVIYKVVSKETLSEEDANNDIVRAIAQRKYDDAIRAITETAKPEFNAAYFGSPSPAHAASPHP